MPTAKLEKSEEFPVLPDHQKEFEKGLEDLSNKYSQQEEYQTVLEMTKSFLAEKEGENLDIKNIIKNEVYNAEELNYDFKIMPEFDNRKLLEKRMADLVEKIAQNNITNLVFLDKSARPIYHILREIWKTNFPDRKMPAINFLNIGSEISHTLDKKMKKGGFLSNNTPEEILQESFEIIGELKSTELAEVIGGGDVNKGYLEIERVKNQYKYLAEGSKHNNVLIVDEYTHTGKTQALAKKTLETIFPKLHVDIFTVAGAEIERDENPFLQRNYGLFGSYSLVMPSWSEGLDEAKANYELHNFGRKDFTDSNFGIARIIDRGENPSLTAQSLTPQKRKEQLETTQTKLIEAKNHLDQLVKEILLDFQNVPANIGEVCKKAGRNFEYNDLLKIHQELLSSVDQYQKRPTETWTWYSLEEKITKLQNKIKRIEDIYQYKVLEDNDKIYTKYQKNINQLAQTLKEVITGNETKDKLASNKPKIYYDEMKNIAKEFGQNFPKTIEILRESLNPQNDSEKKEEILTTQEQKINELVRKIDWQTFAEQCLTKTSHELDTEKHEWIEKPDPWIRSYLALLGEAARFNPEGFKDFIKNKYQKPELKTIQAVIATLKQEKNLSSLLCFLGDFKVTDKDTFQEFLKEGMISEQDQQKIFDYAMNEFRDKIKEGGMLLEIIYTEAKDIWGDKFTENPSIKRQMKENWDNLVKEAQTSVIRRPEFITRQLAEVQSIKPEDQEDLSVSAENWQKAFEELEYYADECKDADDAMKFFRSARILRGLSVK